MSFNLSNYVNLPNVLKLLGIVLFALAMFMAWKSSGVLTRFLLVSGPIAWYVGEKFRQIYPS